MGKFGVLQNQPNGEIMDTSVILRVSPEGPYYAIGIRNSFGLAVDPITGTLWATENGDKDFDEINMIPEKFNSGWRVTMGPATESELSNLPSYEDYVYGDPKFSWETPVAPTALAFAEFKEIDAYNNALFVGDCNYGNLYKFELNRERNGFEFDTSFLKDNVVNKNETMEEIIIGTGFGCITDIERGPDGFLYVVSLSEGVIYRILPKEASLGILPFEGGGCLIATATFGSELAPQVQFLREIRDNTVLQTQSGTAFMTGFNQFYYSFSPAIADYERENPILKEAVKLTLTPLLTSLTLLQFADIDSESEMLGYGIGIILLNIGIYFVAPVVLVMKVRKIRLFG